MLPKSLQEELRRMVSTSSHATFSLQPDALFYNPTAYHHGFMLHLGGRMHGFGREEKIETRWFFLFRQNHTHPIIAPEADRVVAKVGKTIASSFRKDGRACTFIDQGGGKDVWFVNHTFWRKVKRI